MPACPASELDWTGLDWTVVDLSNEDIQFSLVVLIIVLTIFFHPQQTNKNRVRSTNGAAGVMDSRKKKKK